MAAFADHGSSVPKPIPDGPLECRGCSGPLEPLRRWGGLCKKCVRDGMRPPRNAAAPSQMRVVGHFQGQSHQRARAAAGKTEHYVLVECTCGRQEQILWSLWVNRRPASCARCHRKRVPRV